MKRRYLYKCQRDLSREHASNIFEFVDIPELHVHAHVRARVTDAAPRECIDHVIVRTVFGHLRTRSRVCIGFLNCMFLYEYAAQV